MKRLITAVLALTCCLTFARFAYADNGTEFGIEDDLTVLGNTGTALDPDVEIKGFSVFGATQAVYTGITPGAGNVVMNGYVRVSSGLYVAESSTFTKRVEFNSASDIFIGGGVTDQVLGKDVSGSMKWMSAGALSDNLGNHTAEKDLLMQTFSIKNANHIVASSMTLTYGITAATAAFSSNATVGGTLDVNNAAYFGTGVNKSTFTAAGALNMANNADITLLGATSKITLPNAPTVGTDAANKTYVDSMASGGGGPWTRVAPNIVKLSTIADSVGIGIAVPTAKMHVSSANAAVSDMLVIASSGTTAAQQVFTVDAAGDAFMKGSVQMGDDRASDTHGINTAPVALVALKVDGPGAAGGTNYTAQFLSGGSLAAWIRKK